jgi:dTDP-L-rhamnose 4-epimerase
VKVLITGGAGFIGSHLADRLLAAGAKVRILDSLEPQVHGEDRAGRAGPELPPRNGPLRRSDPAAWSDRQREASLRGRTPPAYLNPGADLLVGDIRDRSAVLEAIDAVDAIFHFAARVGVGQSMYEIANYTSVNTVGTAVLLEALVDRPVKRLIVASSMSIYGEGRCLLPDGTPIDPPDRTREQLERGEWELRAPDGRLLTPVATPEEKHPSLASVYALSKYDQERLCLIFGAAYRVPTVALRFFNVYGTRQALSNPYTGVLAIFASRLLNNKPPSIFEDGLQRRDFVSVHDVVSACMLALESPRAPGRAFNIGSGRSVTVREVAEALRSTLASQQVNGVRAAGAGVREYARTAHPSPEGPPPLISGKYRAGDIRHCFADVTLARELLEYEPRIEFQDGLAELAEWLQGQQAVDRVDAATRELASRGLTL